MSEFVIKPTVCAVGDTYQIMVPVKCESLVKVETGGKYYYNHSNGIRRSRVAVQKITVPMKELDRAKKYTVVYEKVIKRGDYSCDKMPPVSATFSFRPVTKKTGINIYHLSDTHGLYKPAVKAAQWFGGDLDLLILNGDIASHSTSINDIMLSYKIAFDVTHGEIPVVISRGNHDLRGRYAEQLENLMPSDKGLSYYNIRLGSLWMSLVDTGEDKEDWHREYGGTAAFHQMREEENSFLEETVKNKNKTYAAKGVKYKMIVSHVPFTRRNTDECKGECPFDIENEIYNSWTDTIKNFIRPDFMLAGHYHICKVWRPGGEEDDRNIPFDVLVGSRPAHDQNLMTGAAITLGEGRAEVVFNDGNKKVYGRDTVIFPDYD